MNGPNHTNEKTPAGRIAAAARLLDRLAKLCQSLLRLLRLLDAIREWMQGGGWPWT